MALDIFSPNTMLAAVQETNPLHTFLRDRYFPTNNSTDMFGKMINELIEDPDHPLKLFNCAKKRNHLQHNRKNKYKNKKVSHKYAPFRYPDIQDHPEEDIQSQNQNKDT